jgi:outer membrane protein OmpA-like peptidoglycan-associated protein
VKTFIVFFDFNQAVLTPEARNTVAQAVQAVKAQNAVRIAVTGHTDTVGSVRFNQALSERRAASIKAAMVSSGIAADAIATQGRNFSDPLVKTGPNVREPQNRRAVIDLNP